MSGILNSGKLATLLSRLTSTRAGYLDAAISSRASATNYTAARAAKLDYLDAAISSISAASPPPTALYGRSTSNGELESITAFDNFGQYTGYTNISTYDSWTEIVGVASDSGVIELLSVGINSNSSNLNAQARLLIDGVAVYTSDTTLWQSSSDNLKGVCIVGATRWTSAVSPAEATISYGNIPFSSSFSLQVKKTENSAGNFDAYGYYRYYTT